MTRYEIFCRIAPLLKDQLVICNIGTPSQELFAIMDQPSNFYMLGTMGLASSIGLGLALTQFKTVISIDGDGSILTNLGTLPTIGNHCPANYILLIIDNGSYGSTGDQPTYTSGKTDLAGIAKSAGCDRVIQVEGKDIRKTLEHAIKIQKCTVIVVKCASGNFTAPVIPIDPVVIKDRFMKAIAN